MPNFRLIICFCFVQASLFAQKSITLQDCFTYFKFYPGFGGEFHYLKDGARYAEADEKGLRLLDVRKPDFDSLTTLSLPEAAAGFDAFEFLFQVSLSGSWFEVMRLKFNFLLFQRILSF